MLISMAGSLSERPFHEYRQRIWLVRWERRYVLETRAPVELQGTGAHIAGLEPSDGQLLRTCPIEQFHEHRERDTAAARLRLEIHALELRPAPAMLRGATSDQLAVLLDHEEYAVRGAERLRRVEVIALLWIQGGVECV